MLNNFSGPTSQIRERIIAIQQQTCDVVEKWVRMQRDLWGSSNSSASQLWYWPDYLIDSGIPGIQLRLGSNPIGQFFANEYRIMRSEQGIFCGCENIQQAIDRAEDLCITKSDFPLIAADRVFKSRLIPDDIRKTLRSEWRTLILLIYKCNKMRKSETLTQAQQNDAWETLLGYCNVLEKSAFSKITADL